jgi:hypothetical protein
MAIQGPSILFVDRILRSRVVIRLDIECCCSTGAALNHSFVNLDDEFHPH